MEYSKHDYTVKDWNICTDHRNTFFLRFWFPRLYSQPLIKLKDTGHCQNKELSDKFLTKQQYLYLKRTVILSAIGA